MAAQPGFYRCLIVPKDAFADLQAYGNADNMLSLGLHLEGEFTWEEDAQPEASGGQLIKGYTVNFKCKTEHAALRDFQKAVYFSYNECDMQLAFNPQTSVITSGGVITLTGNNRVRPKFKYVISHMEKTLEISFTRFYREQVWRAIIDASDSGISLLPIISGFPGVSGGNERGQNFNNRQKPFFISIRIPSPALLLTQLELEERELSFESIGTESASYKYFNLDYIYTRLYVKTKKATITDILSFLNKADAPLIDWNEAIVHDGLVSSKTEQYLFQTNTLMRSSVKGIISPETREQEIEYRRNFTYQQFTFNYGTGFNGTGVDEGAGGFNEADARLGGRLNVTV